MIFVEEDTLVDGKYWRVYRQGESYNAERKLMFAVLLDAIQTYQKFSDSKSTRGKILHREAEAWFWSEESEAVFSFVNICDVFGLNPGAFRRHLKDLLDQRIRVSRGNVVRFRPGVGRPGRARFLGAG